MKIYIELSCGHVIQEPGDRGRKIGQLLICPQCPTDTEAQRVESITRVYTKKEQADNGN